MSATVLPLPKYMYVCIYMYTHKYTFRKIYTSVSQNSLPLQADISEVYKWMYRTDWLHLEQVWAGLSWEKGTGQHGKGCILAYVLWKKRNSDSSTAVTHLAPITSTKFTLKKSLSEKTGGKNVRICKYTYTKEEHMNTHQNRTVHQKCNVIQ